MISIAIVVGLMALNEVSAAPVGSCPAVDGSDPVYLTHESDCTKFYECSNGVPYLFDCPADLYFDPSLNVCNWPDQVDCKRPSPTSPEPEPEPTTEDDTSIDDGDGDGDDDDSKGDDDSEDDDDSSDDSSDSDSDSSSDSEEDSNEDEESDGGDDSKEEGDEDEGDDDDEEEEDAKLAGILLGVDPLNGEVCAPAIRSSSLKAHPTNCARYLNCYNGKHVVKACIKNFSFDEMSHICAPAEVIKCAAA